MSSGAGREAAKAALLALGVSLPRGEKYNNSEEGIEQLMRLPHRSPQRGAAIKLMCRGGYFSDKERTIYKRLKKATQLKNDCVPPQKTNTTSIFDFGHEGEGYADIDYARNNIRQAIRWKGSIVYYRLFRPLCILLHLAISSSQHTAFYNQLTFVVSSETVTLRLMMPLNHFLVIILIPKTGKKCVRRRG